MRKPLRSGAITRDSRGIPSLLDRLTDDAPQRREELPSQRLMSQGAFRAAVLRDLAWLFNSINSADLIDPESNPHVGASVLNFGIHCLAGKCISDIDVKALEKAMAAAIRSFEPRIIPDDLEVRCVAAGQDTTQVNLLTIEIVGWLNHRSAPMPFVFRTDVDIECGRFEFKAAG